jgi:hypothetical protein
MTQVTSTGASVNYPPHPPARKRRRCHNQALANPAHVPNLPGSSCGPAKINRRRRQVGAATWSSIAAAISREQFFLVLHEPLSPRIRPSVAKLKWMQREPGMAVTATMEEAA